MSEIPNEYTIAKFQELGYKTSFDKHSNVYKCCCPICREGKSWGKKKRCFYMVEKDLIFCHNCGWSSKPYRWIREVSGMSREEIYDEIKSGDYEYQDIFKILEDTPIVGNNYSLPTDCINLFDPLQRAHYKGNAVVEGVYAYLTKRRLESAVNRPDALYVSLDDRIHKNRLIIPFKDAKGDIRFYQSRKVFEWDDIDHYISKKHGDKNLFGIDKISSEYDMIPIFEGPIDSFFVKNSLALGGITEKSDSIMTFAQQKEMDALSFYDHVYVLDSQWIDKTARDKTNILLNMGYKVFIWPEKLGKRFKDFNEMCIHLQLDEISHEFIKKHTHKGLAGVVKMKMIK